VCANPPEIVLAYPERSDVNGRPAHEEILILSPADVQRLLETEVDETGAYGITLDAGGRNVQ
jgi:hypothetical protein